VKYLKILKYALQTLVDVRKERRRTGSKGNFAKPAPRYRKSLKGYSSRCDKEYCKSYRPFCAFKQPGSGALVITWLLTPSENPAKIHVFYPANQVRAAGLGHNLIMAAAACLRLIKRPIPILEKLYWFNIIRNLSIPCPVRTTLYSSPLKTKGG
jgi:hypothetical protein